MSKILNTDDALDESQEIFDFLSPEDVMVGIDFCDVPGYGHWRRQGFEIVETLVFNGKPGVTGAATLEDFADFGIQPPPLTPSHHSIPIHPIPSGPSP